MDKSSNPN